MSAGWGLVTRGIGQENWAGELARRTGQENWGLGAGQLRDWGWGFGAVRPWGRRFWCRNVVLLEDKRLGAGCGLAWVWLGASWDLVEIWLGWCAA